MSVKTCPVHFMVIKVFYKYSIFHIGYIKNKSLVLYELKFF